MSGPGVVPVITGTAVLGTKFIAGQGLAATGVAIGAYVGLALACIAAGTCARMVARRRDRSAA